MWLMDTQAGNGVFGPDEEDPARLFRAPRDPTLRPFAPSRPRKPGSRLLLRRSTTALGEPFTRAVETLGSISGRVIVTGVGKSGHIGAKIAATMASTGTPCAFRASGGSQSWRSGHDRQGRCDHRVVLVGRKRRVEGYSGLFPPLRHSISSLLRRARIQRWRGKRTSCCCCRASRRPVRTGWRRQPRRSCNWRLAMRLRWPCWKPRGLPRAISTPSIRAGSSVRRWRMSPTSCTPAIPCRWFRSGTPAPEAIMTLSQRKFGCVGVTGADGRLIGIVTDGDVARNLGTQSGRSADRCDHDQSTRRRLRPRRWPAPRWRS
jgi:arabinose-5-phosphate isomerase